MLFNTLAYTQRLRHAGIGETQAHAHAEALTLAFSEGVATHEDIVVLAAGVDQRFIDLESRWDRRITGLQNYWDARITDLQNQGDRRFQNQRWLMILLILVVTITSPLALQILHGLGVAT
ncbi:MAG: hypothetical protein ACYCT3_07405 [Acidiferrobacter sp.]